jgi:hypothetical protein
MILAEGLRARHVCMSLNATHNEKLADLVRRRDMLAALEVRRGGPFANCPVLGEGHLA